MRARRRGGASVAFARESNDGVQTLELELEHAAAERRHAVVASACVVGFVRRARRRAAASSISARRQHALNRAVERAGAHPDCALRRLFDVLRDRVAVALSVAQSEEDVQHDGRERELGLRVAGHGQTISVDGCSAQGPCGGPAPVRCGWPRREASRAMALLVAPRRKHPAEHVRRDDHQRDLERECRHARHLDDREDREHDVEQRHQESRQRHGAKPHRRTRRHAAQPEQRDREHHHVRERVEDSARVAQQLERLGLADADRG